MAGAPPLASQVAYSERTCLSCKAAPMICTTIGSVTPGDSNMAPERGGSADRRRPSTACRRGRRGNRQVGTSLLIVPDGRLVVCLGSPVTNTVEKITMNQISRESLLVIPALVGAVAGVIVGLLTRPALFGTPIPLSILMSQHPLGAAIRAQTWRSCRECCGNSLAARSGHVDARFFRRRGQGASVRWAEREFPSHQPFASGSGRRRAAPRVASARSRHRAGRFGS